MKNATKTTKTNKAKDSKTDWLEELNEEYKCFSVIHDALIKALSEGNEKEIRRCRKASDESYEFMTLARKHLPALRFDTVQGEYFPARDEHGNRQFRVQASLTRVVENVIAKDGKDAERKVYDHFVEEGYWNTVEMKCVCEPV